MKALAIKYRPKKFEDVVEQEAIKKILKYQIESKTNKNCYLFTGGAGTGKTTCARIFAQEINKGNGNPIEVDAASNNGVENVRGIIDNAKFKSMDSEFKVYIIDECHMLSNGAWNAMLKLIEEPPAKTLFLFCTTDPQKIPATILSRVQRYDFKKITYQAIIERLIFILDKEQIKYQKDAIEYIATLAEGGMRDAITMLDKCISYDSHLTIESVVNSLGTANYSTFFELLDGILNVKKKEVILLIDTIYYNGMDLKQFLKQFSYFIMDIIKYVALGDFKYNNIPKIYKKELDKIITGDKENRNILLDILDFILKLNKDIKWENNVRQEIEANLIIYLR